MDMDGKSDVIAFGTGQLTVWGGDGAGSWTQIASLTTPAPGYAQALRVGGDADHNGFPDIVLVSEEGSWPSGQNHLHFYKEASLPSTLEIKPVTPSENKAYFAGAVTFVDWISAVPDGGAGTVSLELSLHGPHGPWQPITSNQPDNGRYQWLISSDLPSTDDAYIRYTLTNANGSAQAVTPAAFKILGTTQEPISGLSASNDSPTVLGETTVLSATVISGTNVTYSWELGDGSTSVGAVVSHVFPETGIYTATVTATNSISQAQAQTMVEIYQIPITGLLAFNSSPTVLGDSTYLTATVISGSNVLYEWDLGDGITATGATVSHVYPDIGFFTAVVTATNSVSQVVASTQVEVYEMPITGLLAFNSSPTILGEITTLTATITTGSNVVFTWDLGDGFTDSGATVNHIYPAAGDYIAIVTAHNAIGEVDASTTVHIVFIPPTRYIWLPMLWRGG
jgi:hypothetical protein